LAQESCFVKLIPRSDLAAVEVEYLSRFSIVPLSTPVVGELHQSCRSMMAYNKAANRASLVQQKATKTDSALMAANRASVADGTAKSDAVLMACGEDDARSTSASSGHGDGGSDVHAISSDEERETALKQSQVAQHRNVLANAPWRQGKRQQQQKQLKQQNDASSRLGQLRAPPGLPPPATNITCKAAPATCSHPVFTPPPGLPSPPGLELPPGLPLPEAAPAAFEYTAQAFRRELTNIMRELRLHKNPGLAVSQVRNCSVPRQRQAAEYADILTRAAEESRGPARRICMAFVGGVAKAFEKEECIAGLRMFFDVVYPDLCDEVPRLRSIVMTELFPVLKVVLEDGELGALQSSLVDALGCHAA